MNEIVDLPTRLLAHERKLLDFMLAELGPQPDRAIPITNREAAEACGMAATTADKGIAALGRMGFILTERRNVADGTTRTFRRRGVALTPDRSAPRLPVLPWPHDPAAERRFLAAVLAEQRRLPLWATVTAVLGDMRADGISRARTVDLAASAGIAERKFSHDLKHCYRLGLLTCRSNRDEHLEWGHVRYRGPLLLAVRPTETETCRDVGMVWQVLAQTRGTYAARKYPTYVAGRVALWLLAETEHDITTAATSDEIGAALEVPAGSVRMALRLLYKLGIIENRSGSMPNRPVRGRGPALQDRIAPRDPDGTRGDMADMSYIDDVDRSDHNHPITVITPDPVELDRVPIDKRCQHRVEAEYDAMRAALGRKTAPLSAAYLLLRDMDADGLSKLTDNDIADYLEAPRPTVAHDVAVLYRCGILAGPTGLHPHGYFQRWRGPALAAWCPRRKRYTTWPEDWERLSERMYARSVIRAERPEMMIVAKTLDQILEAIDPATGAAPIDDDEIARRLGHFRGSISHYVEVLRSLKLITRQNRTYRRGPRLKAWR